MNEVSLKEVEDTIADMFLFSSTKSSLANSTT